MKAVRLILLVAVGAVFMYYTALPGDLPAATDTTAGLAGTYSVNGVDPTGAEFSGTAVIRDTDDDRAYTMDLILTGSIQQAEGELSGNRFTGTWQTVSSAIGGEVGTFDYVRSTDGTMSGTWVVDGVDADSRPATIEFFPDP